MPSIGRPAPFAAGGFVAGLAVLAAVVAQGPGATPAAAACRAGGWAPTAAGRPAKPLAATGARYAVYRAGGAWHLLVNGAPGAMLAGRITADRTVSVRRRPAWLHRSGGALSFRLTSTGHVREAAFTTGCAKRVAASFQTDGATDRVLLGAAGHTPTPSFALERPLETGVSGQVLKARRCPLGGAPECASMKGQPVPGDVRIETVPSRRDEPSRPVKTITTDADGRF